jgi:hypothetical protein
VRSNSYILFIGVEGSATSTVWPRVGYMDVSRTSSRVSAPRPVALSTRLVLGWEERSSVMEETLRRSSLMPLLRAWD